MTKQNITAPQRADHVGSYLRPSCLKEARAQYAEGRITAQQLEDVKHEAIRQLVKRQKEAGLRIISDGEYNRAYWHLDFMWGFDGVGHSKGGGVPFHGETAALDNTFLVGRIAPKPHHPFIDDFRFLRQFEEEGIRAKLTVPSPAQFFQQFLIPQNFLATRRIYPTNEELIDDVAHAYQDFIRQFYDAGGRILQFDDCTWGAVVGDAAELRYKAVGLALDTIKEQLLTVNNKALEGRPSDLTVTTHICRGNYHSTYFTSGPYDSVADYVFARENVDALYLEYDDERSGSFEALAKVSKDKKVVLGLITTKTPELEDKETIISRIREASQYIPLERLYLSPQCGFASCEIGNKLTEDEQWAKIALVQDIAREVWGERE
ncbi:MAG: 5-methyltetrahydropteroyltriglutamate--homocysteine S-methyltransferase [Bacteroidaceae bacterium]|nr:5-methyltetrahydropteroyltriglutamate--homocysteine S-methyltransferase [Bacteroidaceae bacterium]